MSEEDRERIVEWLRKERDKSIKDLIETVDFYIELIEKTSSYNAGDKFGRLYYGNAGREINSLKAAKNRLLGRLAIAAE